MPPGYCIRANWNFVTAGTPAVDRLSEESAPKTQHVNEIDRAKLTHATPTASHFRGGNCGLWSAPNILCPEGHWHLSFHLASSPLIFGIVRPPVFSGHHYSLDRMMMFQYANGSARLLRRPVGGNRRRHRECGIGPCCRHQCGPNGAGRRTHQRINAGVGKWRLYLLAPTLR